MKILAFGHRKHVGKDTAANFLVSHLRINTKNQRIGKRGFASALYAICNQVYGWAGFETEDYYEKNPAKKDEKLEAIGCTPRDVLIKIGTGCFREIYEDTWVDYLSKTASFDYLVIKDTRFPNEFRCVKDSGGYCIRIDRPSVPNTDDEADTLLAGYPDSAWDAIILNNGSLNDLHANVMQVSRRFLGV